MKKIFKALTSLLFIAFMSFCMFHCFTSKVTNHITLYYVCAAIFSCSVPIIICIMWHYINYQERKIKQLLNLLDKVIQIKSDN
ncbi:hypothetical protein DW253_12115 [Ruminococcus sp. AM22-13]|nr:hypothetical protein DW253_12115 [Ruminococcus sp. AM22-13]